MKKRFMALLLFFLLIFSVSAAAEENLSIKANVDGTIAVGENISISVYADNAKKLYAGDIKFKFNPDVLQITDIERGSLISQKGVGNFEQKYMPGDGSTPKDVVRYLFTCTGQTDGYTGDGPIVVFKAKVLKKADFYINSKPLTKEVSELYNLNLQLCDSSITKELEYKFTPYGKVPADTGTGQDTPGDTGNTESTGNTGSSTGNSTPAPAADGAGGGTGAAGGKQITRQAAGSNGNGSKQTTGEAGQIIKASDNVKVTGKNDEKNNEKNHTYVYIIVFIVAAAAVVGGLYYIRLRKININKN